MTRESVLVLAVLLGTGCKAATSEARPGPVAAASVAAPADQPASSAIPANANAAASASQSAAEPSLLAVGADVPDVSAVAQDGKTVKLRALKGKPVIVYFYPKDDTTGCTIEAKGIRDQYSELNGRAVVLGVSTDTSESHKAFADKYNLPFQLLDDSSHALVTAFGVPVSSGHAKRVTFVIDGAGKVRKVFPNVNPDGHAAELLDALKSLG
jgi:peroxiredoxin Q/BCP